jgi:predicted unusual protein kinase regulating ubiquinone biosynthesis (AarF/ABC1/UbiB family)
MAKRIDSIDPQDSQRLEGDPQQSIRTSLLMRTLTLTRLGLVLSSKTASHRIGRALSSQTAEEEQRLNQEHLVSQAREIASQMGELKGSVLKVGQMLSLYGEHFLPPEVNLVFRELHSGARPLAWTLVEPVLRSQEFASDVLNQLEFDEKPVASASLGQVHRARQRNGSNVYAVKIQHPGIDQAVLADLKALQVLLSWGRLLNIPKAVVNGLFDEIASMLQREIDYITEAKTADSYRSLLGSDLRYIVPQVHPQWRSRNCLVMDFIDGVSVASPEVSQLSEARRLRLAEAILELHFKEIFQFRMTQTDAHMGNFLIQVDSSGAEQDKWVLLDFGAVREYSESFLDHYRLLVRSSLNGHLEDLKIAALELGFLQASDSSELADEFAKLCVLFTEPFRGRYNWQTSDLPDRIAAQVRALVSRFEFRPPPRDILFLDRKVSGLAVLLKHLGVTTDGTGLVKKYL